VLGEENMVVRVPDNITVVIEIIFDTVRQTTPGITAATHYIIRKLEPQARVSSLSTS
jgi:hypothetical protein